MNKVILSGKVVSTPIKRESSTGKSFATFTLLTFHETPNKKFQPIYHSISVWSEQQDLVVQKVNKGANINLEGSIVYYKNARNGANFKNAVIIAHHIEVTYAPYWTQEEKERNATEHLISEDYTAMNGDVMNIPSFDDAGDFSI